MNSNHNKYLNIDMHMAINILTLHSITQIE